MRKPVQNDCMQAWATGENYPLAVDSRVPVENALDIKKKSFEHGR